MKLEYVSQEKLQQLIKEVFGRHLQAGGYRLFFFGSRVKGDSFSHSDIDLGVESSQKLSSQVKLSIEEDLQNLPILYKIDLVDFGNVSEDFRKIALQNAEFI